jgi:hypothetical protein
MFTIRFKVDGQSHTVLPGMGREDAEAIAFILACCRRVDEDSCEVRPLPRPLDLVTAWNSYKTPMRVTPEDEKERIIPIDIRDEDDCLLDPES